MCSTVSTTASWTSTEYPYLLWPWQCYVCTWSTVQYSLPRPIWGSLHCRRRYSGCNLTSKRSVVNSVQCVLYTYDRVIDSLFLFIHAWCARGDHDIAPLPGTLTRWRGPREHTGHPCSSTGSTGSRRACRTRSTGAQTWTRNAVLWKYHAYQKLHVQYIRRLLNTTCCTYIHICG
jgi:hypothetical protein